MSVQKLRNSLIQLIPNRKLKYWLSYNYGWFPGNFVAPDVRISAIKKLKLGGDVWIGGYGAAIHAGGGIKIGRNTKIGEGCFFISSNHNYMSKTHVPFDNIGLLQSIEIGENCWIGARCMICPGVKIEDGAIIAMGSVVSKSVPKCAIVGGNPARIIGWRNKEEYENNAKLNRTYHEEPTIDTIVEGFKEFLK